MTSEKGVASPNASTAKKPDRNPLRVPHFQELLGRYSATHNVLDVGSGLTNRDTTRFPTELHRFVLVPAFKGLHHFRLGGHVQLNIYI